LPDQNSGIPVAGLNNVFLGNDINGLRGFDGLIQDVKIWNKILSEEELIKDYNAWKSAYYESDVIDVNNEQVINSIVVNEGYPLNSSELSESNVLYDANLLALYNFNGNALDSSLGGHGGSATNMSWKPGLWQTQAAEFNRVDSVIDTGSDWIGTGDITLSVWIKPYSFGENDLGRIIDNGKSFINLYGAGLRVEYRNAGYSQVYSANIIETNKWQHIVVTRSASGLVNFYIDGELSGTPDQNAGVNLIGSTNVNIGNNAGLGRTFDGVISKLKVFDCALTSLQVKDLYNRELGGRR